MRSLHLMVPCFLLLILPGCDTGFEGTIDPGPVFTGDDPFNDLTVLGDRFYLTNFDFNEGSGDRVNLYSFDLSGQPVGKFNLQMNGQGYISIISAEGALFLFCRSGGLLLRVTPSGELAAMSWPGAGFIGWQAGGLLATTGGGLYVLLWKFSGEVNVYILDPASLTMELSEDPYKQLVFPLRVDFRSLCADDQSDCYYLLCSDLSGADFIMVLDPGWILTDEIALSDSLVAGITYNQGEIWVSTEDRRINTLNQILSSP